MEVLVTKPYRTVYIDDEINDRMTKGIQKQLSQSVEFECSLKRPPTDVVEAADGLPDALLVDFDLSMQPSDEPAPGYVSYYGSTLAAEVRMRRPSCPIVLITKKERIAGRIGFIEESLDVDLVLFKNDIIENPDRARTAIKDLIDGFRALAAVKGGNWQEVLPLMGASQEEANLLREASPPVGKDEWNIPQTARWLRTVVLGFPGILYDELTAATRLGITQESFQSEPVQKVIRDARYVGPFGTHQKRWWRDRLFTAALVLAAEHNLRGTIAHTFGQSIACSTGWEPEPAVCVYDETPIADWVCYVLQLPVKQSNSVPYFPDKRPRVMDQARVSFKAIDSSERFDDTLVDSDSADLVQRRWKEERA